jgi:uncharacterized protein
MPEAAEFLSDWFQRLSGGDWSAEIFLGALADDVVWTATGSSPISGTFHGLREYAEKVYRPLDEHLAVWPKPIVERIVAEGEWGAVQFRSVDGVGRNGTDYSMQYCWVIHVVDEKIIEVIGYYDQEKVAQLFTP